MCNHFATLHALLKKLSMHKIIYSTGMCIYVYMYAYIYLPGMGIVYFDLDVALKIEVIHTSH